MCICLCVFPTLVLLLALLIIMCASTITLFSLLDLPLFCAYQKQIKFYAFIKKTHSCQLG